MGSIVFLIIIFIIFIVLIINETTTKTGNDQTKDTQYEEQQNIKIYKAKNSILTNNEKEFYNKLFQVVDKNYLVLPQINLGSVVEKIDGSKFRNELFRIIDFGIFDRKTLKPLLLIELNDKTHKQAERYQRDLKVREILKDAGLPLLTFYSSYPNEIDYLHKKIYQILDNKK